MSYCRIHTSKITHLRGSVNAFPAVQPPHFSSNNLSMQHQPTSIAFEWCITWVEVTTNPQAGIPRECPTAHITMESFVNTSSVIPWTTNEYDCKPNTITAFCNTSISTALNEWQCGLMLPAPSCYYLHFPQCHYLLNFQQNLLPWLTHSHHLPLQHSSPENSHTSQTFQYTTCLSLSSLYYKRMQMQMT
jgi:hypothetical protein